MNHEKIQNKIPCYRCRVRSAHFGETLCLTCKEDEKVKKFLSPGLSEGQQLDEDLFPTDINHNVLTLTK